MDGDCMSSGEDISSIESATENEIKEKGGRHTPAQQATLNAYFKFGMVGIGKTYSALITTASRECGLSEKKVKVRINLTSMSNFCFVLCVGYTLID